MSLLPPKMSHYWKEARKSKKCTRHHCYGLKTTRSFLLPIPPKTKANNKQTNKNHFYPKIFRTNKENSCPKDFLKRGFWMHEPRCKARASCLILSVTSPASIVPVSFTLAHVGPTVHNSPGTTRNHKGDLWGSAAMT